MRGEDIIERAIDVTMGSIRPRKPVQMMRVKRMSAADFAPDRLGEIPAELKGDPVGDPLPYKNGVVVQDYENVLEIKIPGMKKHNYFKPRKAVGWALIRWLKGHAQLTGSLPKKSISELDRAVTNYKQIIASIEPDSYRKPPASEMGSLLSDKLKYGPRAAPEMRVFQYTKGILVDHNNNRYEWFDRARKEDAWTKIKAYAALMSQKKSFKERE